ncbi:cryptochrome/photolyase family protein [Balneolales bacterium ANBcel1]|nr:cryptochrome/photolyase family protein [Balneolales bacterium ANBcel1]
MEREKSAENKPANGRTGLVFPHQLFENSPLPDRCETLYLIEEHLFFNQYPFHKQKIAFHRASMKAYEAWLHQNGYQTVYVEAMQAQADIRKLIAKLHGRGVSHIEYIDPVDQWLEQRIQESADRAEISLRKHESPLFYNTESEIREYFAGKKRMYQTSFYKDQRLKRNILMDKDGKPSGGSWTYDALNRLKYPKSRKPPEVSAPPCNDFYQEAASYTESYFGDNYGSLSSSFRYPCTFEESKTWLQNFLQERFREFGPYEDAIVADEVFLHHSVLSPLLNTGLLHPEYVITQALAHAEEHSIPVESLEGFIRQVIGWREFIRAVYLLKGTGERTRNFWGFRRKIPNSFWTGKTGIEPLDLTIGKVQSYGYAHHIERLMVIGSFMLLCEFDPDEVYRWFMEMFVDSYDWVMVPNVYGMSQFADGGLMATKPYISGSNYLMKMSNFRKGEWQKTWDGLFWRFLHVHRDVFQANPRLKMLVTTFDRMSREKRDAHLKNAEAYLQSLDQ